MEVQNMNDDKWSKLKKQYYRSNTVSQIDDGTIDFSLDDYHKLETNSNRITYDDYLEIMRESGNRTRHYFEMCFYAGGGYVECKGEIQRFAKNKHKVIFKRIFVSGMYLDGTCFDGKEDHVWMDDSGFEKFDIGDDVSFTAEVYRYLKTGDGKKIDYALRNPKNIEGTGNYNLPNDDALLMQSIDSIICKTCMHTDHCYGFCLNKSWRDEMRESMFSALKESKIKSK